MNLRVMMSNSWDNIINTYREAFKREREGGEEMTFRNSLSSTVCHKCHQGMIKFGPAEPDDICALCQFDLDNNHDDDFKEPGWWKVKKCECGAVKANTPFHAHYCPFYRTVFKKSEDKDGQ